MLDYSRVPGWCSICFQIMALLLPSKGGMESGHENIQTGVPFGLWFYTPGKAKLTELNNDYIYIYTYVYIYIYTHRSWTCQKTAPVTFQVFSFWPIQPYNYVLLFQVVLIWLYPNIIPALVKTFFYWFKGVLFEILLIPRLSMLSSVPVPFCFIKPNHTYNYPVANTTRRLEGDMCRICLLQPTWVQISWSQPQMLP